MDSDNHAAKVAALREGGSAFCSERSFAWLCDEADKARDVAGLDAVTRMRLASGKKCASCGVPLPQERPGPGRPRVYCDIHRTPDEAVIRERAKRVNGGIPMNGRCRHVIVDGVCRRCGMSF